VISILQESSSETVPVYKAKIGKTIEQACDKDKDQDDDNNDTDDDDDTIEEWCELPRRIADQVSTFS
jgi:hypothetical protein